MFRSARLWALLSIVTVIVAGAFVGCSDDPMTGTEPVDDSGLVRGGIDPALGDFEFTVATAGDPSQPFYGPFVIRGRNIHYDEAIGALVADLSVVNRSINAFPEPIGLTFLSLLPEGVEVLNPDNGIHGAGAAIVFQFANDDAIWTPGEGSLPHPVQFKTERGRAVAFVARIDIGDEPVGGSIGGIVWNDQNRDGAMGSDEDGIGGVEIVLVREDGPEITTRQEVLYRTRTNSDGVYRFDGLRPGLYHVQMPPSRACEPTTPTEIQVILVLEDGDVSDFLAANFGCFLRTLPPDTSFVEVGDWVEATGQYAESPPRLLSRILGVKDCDGPIPPVTVTGGDDCRGLPSELRGPVTAIDLGSRALAVMGTWMLVPPDSGSASSEIRLMIDLEDIEVGDRVRAVVTRPGGPVALTVTELALWLGDEEMVLGFVDWVDRNPYGQPVSLTVLDTHVILTNLTTNGEGP